MAHAWNGWLSSCATVTMQLNGKFVNLFAHSAIDATDQNQTVYRSLPNHSLAISQSLPWILWQQNTRWLINSVEFDGKMINANRRTERKKNIFCLALAIHINGMLLIICNSRDSIVTIAMLSSYSFDGILRVTLTQYVAHTLIIIMMMTMVVVVVYACICQLAFSASECVSARMNKGSRCTDAS